MSAPLVQPGANGSMDGLHSMLNAAAASTTAYLGPGAGLARLHQFAAALRNGCRPSASTSLEQWQSLVREFFHPLATMHLVLWNPASRERKGFELPMSVIPRWLYTNCASGVASMSFMIESPREYLAGQSFPTPPRSIKPELSLPSANVTHFVECAQTTWIMHFDNDWQVHMTGLLRAAFVAGVVKNANQNGASATYGSTDGPLQQALVLESFDFIASNHTNVIGCSALTVASHEEAIPTSVVDSILAANGVVKSSSEDGSEIAAKNEQRNPGTSDINAKSLSQKDEEGETGKSKFSVKVRKVAVPESPVNEYGITLRAMRCLEIAESVCQLRDLMDFTMRDRDKDPEGPIEGLRKLASQYRENGLQGAIATMAQRQGEAAGK